MCLLAMVPQEKTCAFALNLVSTGNTVACPQRRKKTVKTPINKNNPPTLILTKPLYFSRPDFDDFQASFAPSRQVVQTL